MIQTSIFDLLYKPFKINKPIRLIELFGGYGSQALALKYLGVKYESYKLCEWAVKSIQAYKDIHFTDDNTDYSKNLTTDELKEYLFNKGISSNYNEPMTKQQVNRLGEKQLRTIYNNIKATHNLVNIQQVKGNDLEIIDKDKYCYIMTYSFPCQDLSLAGLGKGMSDTSTRSGMLWEVERILKECEDKPQVLLMENVPQVHNQQNVNDFNKWILSLEEMGYKNYWQDLSATDYGIPQTRVRTFMVSILGDYTYTFPQPIKLEKKLKDMLEDNVDEKYYLSEAMIKYIVADNDKWTGNNEESIINKDIASTLNTNEGSRRCDASNYVSKNRGGTTTLKTSLRGIPDGEYPIDSYNKTLLKDNAGTISTGMSRNQGTMLLIKNSNSKGFLEATDGDGIDISSRMIHHRGTVQKDKSQTISTMGGENVGVVVIGNYSPSNHEASRIVDSDYVAPTIKENHGTITGVVVNDR